MTTTARFARRAEGSSAMLAMGGGTGPVGECRHGAAREHQGNGGVPGEHRKNCAHGEAKEDNGSMKGVPGICHMCIVSRESRSLPDCATPIGYRCAVRYEGVFRTK